MSPVSLTREMRVTVSSRTTPGWFKWWTPTGWRFEPAFFCLLFFAAGKEK
jgi:hypothetical protein